MGLISKLADRASCYREATQRSARQGPLGSNGDIIRGLAFEAARVVDTDPAEPNEKIAQSVRSDRAVLVRRQV